MTKEELTGRFVQCLRDVASAAEHNPDDVPRLIATFERDMGDAIRTLELGSGLPGVLPPHLKVIHTPEARPVDNSGHGTNDPHVVQPSLPPRRDQ